MSGLSDDASLARERDYHNRRYSEETRQAQGKYYSAISPGAVRFGTRLRQLAAGADILEYGCGDRTRAFTLAGTCRSAIGIDISDVAIGRAQAAADEAGLRNIAFTVMNAEAMTFADHSFDLVFGRGIIHHLNLERCFADIARVLRPGGTALFWEPLGHNLPLELYRRFTPGARTPDEHPLLRRDFDLARRFFGEVDLDFYGLTTLLSVPLRDTPLGGRLLRATAALDRLLFRVPGLRWQAWYCLIELRKPRRG
jgi:SAM-dependent methyltransferase